MLLGGLQKTTLIDYPGKVAATVFTAGCNFFCAFCHNPSLVLVQKTPDFPFLSEEQFFWWLEKKIGLLEGICITGGEPTIHEDLPRFIENIKDLGFLVKLDTNGSNPKMLEELINNQLVDYIAIDVKVPLKRYPEVYPEMVDTDSIKRSVHLVQQVPEYEFRTTVVPYLLKEKDLLEIARWLNGSKKYVLQQFRPQNTLNPEVSKLEPYSEKELRRFCELLKDYFEKCEVRV